MFCFSSKINRNYFRGKSRKYMVGVGYKNIWQELNCEVGFYLNAIRNGCNFIIL